MFYTLQVTHEGSSCLTSYRTKKLAEEAVKRYKATYPKESSSWLSVEIIKTERNFGPFQA